MNPCDDCPIDDKIYECCGRFPETGETARFPTRNGDNRPLFACPHLKASGKCGIYENRPYACQAHHCFRYDSINEIGTGLEAFKNQWGDWPGNNEM